MKASHSSHRMQHGFSLIELLMAIAILGVVMAAVVGVFSRSSKLYTTQNAAAALQQEVRAAVEVMAREIRMAGFNPSKSIKYFDLEITDATRIRFSTDLNANGKLDNLAYPNCERVTFRYSSASNSADIFCGNNRSYLIGGPTSNTRVTNLNFQYLNEHGTVTGLKDEIMAVVISLTAQAPAGSAGMIERSFATRVGLRNAAANHAL